MEAEETEPVPPAAPPEWEEVVSAPATTEKVEPGPPAPSPAEKPVSAPKPKRRIPGWVWGLGAVVIVLIAGAALVQSGAFGLPGQQAAAPPATDVASPTAAVTRAATPVPTPALEPVTIFLRGEAMGETVRADQPVVVKWAWGVCDPALLGDNIAALDFKVTIDGQVVADGDMAEYRTQVREEELNGLHAWWQYYAYPMGSLGSGSSYWFELERGFSRQVTDGCDLDGDGSSDWYGPDSGLTTFLQLTVR